MDRHLFAGGNTPFGFYSNFDSIINNSKDGRLIIIKGGSGVGKSTLIKRAALALGANSSIEYFHCSGDSLSLDGAYAENSNLAIIDGTAPHMIDPKYPGIVDEILNLGIYINNKEIKKHGNEIKKLLKEKSIHYSIAYSYLFSAYSIKEIENKIIKENMDSFKINKLAQDFSLKYPSLNKTGYVRKLFSKAFTPEGVVDFTDYENTTFNQIPIICKSNVELNEFLSSLSFILKNNGYHLEQYYNPLRPTEILKIYIKDSNDLILGGQNILSDVNLEKTLNLNNIKNYECIFNINNEILNNLITKACEVIAKAKSLHNNIEKFYIMNIDWEGIEKFSEKFIKELCN